jgi:MoaA/NifB/PqqE/SkfB family radical SAM enzyme
MMDLRRARRLARATANAGLAATFDRVGKAPAAPLMVYVETTRRCNMRCKHCDIWMTAQHHDNLAGTEVPAARLVEVLTGLAPKGLLAVDLFGGEPLLRTDLAEIIRGLKAADLHVTVTTNGNLLNESRCQELLDAHLDQLLVSIDGPDAATHDAIRGREGAFDKALGGLALFTGLADGRARSGINTLVCRPNLARLPRMVDLARSVGAQQLRLLPYHQCYPFNQFTQDDELMPRTSDLSDLAHSLEHVGKEAEDAGLATNSRTYLEGIRRWYQGDPIPVRCQAGLTVCDINAFGDLYPCYTLGKPVGNILRQEFDETLADHRNETSRCDRCWQSCYIEPGLRLSLRALWADRRAVLHDILEYFVARDVPGD